MIRLKECPDESCPFFVSQLAFGSEIAHTSPEVVPMPFTRLSLFLGVLVAVASAALADIYNFTDFANGTAPQNVTGTVNVTQTAAQAISGTVSIDVEGNFIWAH